MDNNKENIKKSKEVDETSADSNSQGSIQLTKNKTASSSTQLPVGVTGRLSTSSLNFITPYQASSAIADSRYADLITANANQVGALAFKIQRHAVKGGKDVECESLDASKYSSQVNYGGGDNSVGTASDSNSFNYHAFDNSMSTLNEKSVPTTLGDIKSFLWKDINQKLSKFSKDLEKSKKSINESMREISKIRVSVSQQTRKIEAFDATLSESENRVKNKVKEFESEIITARNSLLGVIALFASFFTFISISVNIISRDMSLSTSISVLLVIWSCLVSFIFIFMAGISKGGNFFTSSAFIKHAIFMVVLFISSFIIPKVIFSIISVT